MKQIFSTLLILTFAVGSLYSESVESLTSHSDADYPLTNVIDSTDSPSSSLKLLPDNFAESVNINKRFSEFNPQIAVERLYRIKLPSEYQEINPELRQKLFAKILNILGKPETQNGYSYFNSEKNKEVVLIEKTYISNRRGKEIDNLTFSEADLPAEFSYYQFIDDGNSRGGVYEREVTVRDKYISCSSTNIDNIKNFIVTIIKKRGSRTELLFFPENGYLYIYNNIQILKKPPAAKLGISIDTMFTRKLDVTFKWIEANLVF